MQEALIALVFLAAASIIGIFLKPNEDQLRPLSPQPSLGGADDHHDHGHH